MAILALVGRELLADTSVPADASVADTALVQDLSDAVEQRAEEGGAEDLFDNLSWLVEHPLDLNTAVADDLLRVPGITPAEVHILLNLRRRLGHFASLGQLRRVSGAGRKLFYLLAPFARVGISPSHVVRTRSRWIWKRNPTDNAATAPQLGPLSRELQRVDIQLWDGVALGGHMHRDAGEPYRYAFLSGYLRLSGIAMLDELILGDYSVTAGLGLVFGSAIPGARSGAASGDVWTECRIDPYRFTGAGPPQRSRRIKAAALQMRHAFAGWTALQESGGGIARFRRHHDEHRQGMDIHRRA